MGAIAVNTTESRCNTVYMGVAMNNSGLKKWDEEQSLNQQRGKLLKQLRIQRNLSQATLSKEGKPDCICTVRHLRNMEKGLIAPSTFMLNQLLLGLGVTLEEFSAMLYGSSHADFNNRFEVIWNLMFAQNYDKAHIQFSELENDYREHASQQYKQALLLCKANLLRNIENDNHGCIDMLHKAMKLTSPNIFTKSNVVKYKDVAIKTFNKNEYRIFNLLAISYMTIEQNDKCIELLTALIDSLTNPSLPIEIKKEFLPVAFYNLSNILMAKRNYNEAVKLCDKGVAYCNEAISFKTIGYLHYNKGQSLIHLGGDENLHCAIDSFKLSHATFISHGDKHKAEQVKVFAKEKYALDI